MPDKFVTVNTFTLPYEAELARNLLETEGIQAIIGGDLTGGLLPTGEIQLQVPATDAARATGILAAQAAASLDADWEDKAEAGVWTCAICGEPVAENMTVCHSCQTPRDAIRATAPQPLGAIQPVMPPIDPLLEQVRPAPAPPPAPLPAKQGAGDDDEDTAPASAAGDDLARRALRAAVFGAAGAGLLLPLSWWYLLRLVTFPDELSPAGLRDLTLVLLINGLAILVWLSVGLWLF